MPRDTRDEILSAAIAVFFRHGLHRVTVEDVAREAGVSRQTVYTRFGNKEKLFVAAARYLMDEAHERAREALAAPGELWERVRSAFEASNVSHVRELGRSDHAAELWATQSTLLKQVIEGKERRMMGAIAGALRQAQERGEIKLVSGITARELAETLVVADAGFKAHVITVRKYRARLRTVIDMMRQATRP
ncbi:MAG TPA: helix-turn-helix domain-containing protein [Kofleriaceae bacterium]|nr:helix-turn-helix domain-containing protein [Kofleriaceae bacterium]